jgi:hypothetical protein
VASAVSVLCALTSLACAVLLFRGYQARRVRLLLWSGFAFVGFTLGNIMLVVDRIVVGPGVELVLWRSLPVLAGLALLIYGMVWDAG